MEQIVQRAWNRQTKNILINVSQWFCFSRYLLRSIIIIIIYEQFSCKKYLRVWNCYTIRIAAFKAHCRIIYIGKVIIVPILCEYWFFFKNFSIVVFCLSRCLLANWRLCQIVRCMRFNIYSAMGHKLHIKKLHYSEHLNSQQSVACVYMFKCNLFCGCFVLCLLIFVKTK